AVFADDGHFHGCDAPLRTSVGVLLQGLGLLSFDGGVDPAIEVEAGVFTGSGSVPDRGIPVRLDGDVTLQGDFVARPHVDVSGPVDLRAALLTVGNTSPVTIAVTDAAVTGIGGSLHVGAYAGGSILDNVSLEGGPTLRVSSDASLTNVSVGTCTGAVGLNLDGNPATVALTDVTVDGCADQGLRIGPGVTVVGAGGLQLLNNGGSAAEVPGDQIVGLSSVTSVGNGSDAIRVVGGTSLRRSGAWPSGTTIEVDTTLTAGFGSSNPALDLTDVDVRLANGAALEIGTTSTASMTTSSGTTFAPTSGVPGSWTGLRVGAAGTLSATDTEVTGASVGIFTSGRLDLLRTRVSGSTGFGIETSGGSARVDLTDTEVRDNSGSGMKIPVLPAAFQLQQATFTGNAGFGVVATGEVLGVVGGGQATFGTNALGGVEVTGGTMNGGVLTDLGEPYVVTGALTFAGPVTVGVGTDLTFDPGVGLTLASGGTLQMTGATLSSASFPPMAGDWSGLRLNSCGPNTFVVDSTISWAVDAITIAGCDATIDNTFIGPSSGCGINVLSGSPVILSNTFASNGQDICP
ncbi:MAG: hypothetical protein KC621_10150, partial [Myxococcales bacterium]|nr:hypothetical protein [Myxococcales bacterium]